MEEKSQVRRGGRASFMAKDLLFYYVDENSTFVLIHDHHI